MIIVLTIFTAIIVYLIYYNWYLINNIICIRFNNRKKNKNLMNKIV